MRLAVDLGLHYEDGGDIESAMTRDGLKIKVDQNDGEGGPENNIRSYGKRLYQRDMRRRLWWCTYSLDRLVSTCVGRPFGISDQVVTTEFPSSLDDQFITPNGFITPRADSEEPSYKKVAYHYFRLRILQSEILQVLQYTQTQIARSVGQNINNPDIPTRLHSPFLVKFDSFRSWRIDIDRRLYQWKMSAPASQETGVEFSTEFLELNYWQAIIMLYRQSLSVPTLFEGEYNTSAEVNSPTAYPTELREDEDRIYLKVAEAGQKILRIYRMLHVKSLVSYTYLTTHHLFMAGISYLYAIWHSPIVRSRLVSHLFPRGYRRREDSTPNRRELTRRNLQSMDEIDLTVLAAKAVFTDLMDKCPPAETCRDAFDRTAKATIKMVNSTGGFGSLPGGKSRWSTQSTSWESKMDWSSAADSSSTASMPRRRQPQMGSLQIDLPLSDTLSSPSLSVMGDIPSRQSPPLPRAKTFEADHMAAMQGKVPKGVASPVDMALSASGSNGNAIDPSLLPSPTVPRRLTGPQPGPTSPFIPQPSYAQGAAEYPDAQTMDFLQSLQAAPNGDFSGLDPAQLDLGFGINWDDGAHHDMNDGQQVNLFEGFFFGGQQGGGAGGGMGMGGL
jgi:hypothetical protein